MYFHIPFVSLMLSLIVMGIYYHYLPFTIIVMSYLSLGKSTFHPMTLLKISRSFCAHPESAQRQRPSMSQHVPAGPAFKKSSHLVVSWSWVISWGCSVLLMSWWSMLLPAAGRWSKSDKTFEAKISIQARGEKAKLKCTKKQIEVPKVPAETGNLESLEIGESWSQVMESIESFCVWPTLEIFLCANHRYL